jgi:SAM-dependent methyltransferase
MPLFIGFVPTPFENLDVFFELVPLSPSDVVYDLGSGDGRLLFAALEKGAGKAVGVELSPERLEMAREGARTKGIEAKVSFIEADVMDVDLSEATVVLCYLFTTASHALRPKFEAELKPGTRVIMESFPVHRWKPERAEAKNGRTFYLYTMPPDIDENAREDESYTGLPEEYYGMPFYPW